jgi:hypothetical protein
VRRRIEADYEAIQVEEPEKPVPVSGLEDVGIPPELEEGEVREQWASDSIGNDILVSFIMEPCRTSV